MYDVRSGSAASSVFSRSTYIHTYNEERGEEYSTTVHADDRDLWIDACCEWRRIFNDGTVHADDRDLGSVHGSGLFGGMHFDLLCLLRIKWQRFEISTLQTTIQTSGHPWSLLEGTTCMQY
jgi:hypothetical protein